MITFDRVSFGYVPEVAVLSDLSLELAEGLTLVLGPNGCGKSTLLKLAAGVEQPSRGIVRVAGCDLWREEIAARRHLAYLPEHPDLTPYATVSEILELVCGLRRQPPAAVLEALRWVGLERFGDRTVRELSKGQRRRATLAAARIGTPSCLLLDEPLEGLDRGFRDELAEWLRGHLAIGGTTALVVAHDFEPVEALAARAVTVQDGAAVLVDPLPAVGEGRRQLLERLARGGLPGSPPR